MSFIPMELFAIVAAIGASAYGAWTFTPKN